MFPYPKDSGGLGAFPKMPQKQYIQYFLDHWPTIINPTLLFPVDWDVKTTSWSKRECTSSSTESYITALLRPVFKAVPIFRSYKRCICYLYQRRPPCGSPMFVFHCNYWVARFRVRPVIISVFGCLCWKTVFRGEGRHGGLVTRNYVLTNGFIPFFFALALRRIFFVPRLRAPPPPETQKALRIKKKATRVDFTGVIFRCRFCFEFLGICPPTFLGICPPTPPLS